MKERNTERERQEEAHNSPRDNFFSPFGESFLEWFMKIGLIGDIVGRPARTLLAHLLPQIKSQYQLDFIVANAENASHGFGLSLEHANLLKSFGIDVLTGGNHSFDKKEITAYLKEEGSEVLRPHNYSKELEGSGIYTGEVCGEKVAVLNLMGHFGMPHCDNVFVCARESVEALREGGYRNIIVDMHAEATSEKRTIFEMLKGKVGAVFGTHTHIGTDDLLIECGSFYVSDVGMCGGFDSVIGMESEAPIQRGLTGLARAKFEVSKSQRVIVQMIVLDMSEGVVSSAKKIKYIQTLGWLPPLEAVELKGGIE